MTEKLPESGQEFEVRALALARAIHDPSGLQGAVNHNGRERDAVFISKDDIHVYEFTIDGTKAKAQKDATKLHEILSDLTRAAEHALKSATGWFVTRDEPTAEQRAVVAEISGRMKIHAISVATLHQRICNSESYLSCRSNAPFGSIEYLTSSMASGLNIPVKFKGEDGSETGQSSIVSQLIDGKRILISGDFGVGKSHALRELYVDLRKEHFKRRKITPFPVHINLRDCAGLKTPAEILRRHAEEIGFADEKTLISAWRAGACILLLDGFDEIIPVRWLGTTSDLKTVRWEALAPVRRLITEAPSGTGIIVCGRSQYFSSVGEMRDALGLEGGALNYELASFDASQVDDYLEAAGVDWKIPEWLPSRPLLLGYLVSTGGLESVIFDEPRQSSAWRAMLTAICQRESRMFSAVRPEMIKNIIARVATLARSQGSATGPIDMDIMRTAYMAIYSRQPDPEGLQLLLRLPGLAISGGEAKDERVFVDQDLADTAYGEDLAIHIEDPHSEHPLGEMASWVNASSELGIAVAADALQDSKYSIKAALSLANARQNSNKFDAVLADILRVSEILGDLPAGSRPQFLLEGVIFENLTVGAENTVLSNASFTDCLFNTVDLGAIDSTSDVPYFRGGMIGFLEGFASIPEWLSAHFANVEIEQFSSGARTTSSILQLGLGMETRVALTILKKIYAQSGSGRKENALYRGLDASAKRLVPGAIELLMADGWILKQNFGNTTLYLPVRSMRNRALSVLETPGEFRLSTASRS